MCKNATVAYRISVNSVSGTEIVSRVGEDNYMDEDVVTAYRNTHFTTIEVDVTENHYRYGIQSTNFIASGVYNGKSFDLSIVYPSQYNSEEEYTEVIGDFSDEEKNTIESMGFGESLMSVLEVLDSMYRELHPDTPKLYVCTER